MKKFILFFISGLSFGVELHLATNQQLLDELSQRLGSSSTIPISNPAIASYICDSSYLKASLIGPQNTGGFQLYLGDKNKCMEQAHLLSQYKSKIYHFTVMAVCDSSYLKRYSLNPTGELKEIDSTYIGDYNNCFQQAKVINQTSLH